MLDTFNGILAKNKGIMKQVIEGNLLSSMDNGSLDREKFVVFLTQNRIFLKENSGNVAILSARIDSSETSQILLTLSQSMYQEYMFHHQLMNSFGEINNTSLPGHDKPTLDTLSYYSFLFKTCSQYPVSSALTSLLPSLIGRYEMGIRYRKTASKEYLPLFNYYGSSREKGIVEDIIGVYDGLPNHDTEDSLAFGIAARMEARFLEDIFTGSPLI